MIVVGIDFGVSGAVCAIDAQRNSVIHDLPIVEDPNGKRLDAPSFIRLLRTLIPAPGAGFVVGEPVHVMRVSGRTMSHSTETTLVGLRFAAQAACDIARLRMHFVAPQAWKAHYGIKGDSTGSVARQIAASLYPAKAEELKRVKDHNRAESLLIAHYARAKLT